MKIKKIAALNYIRAKFKILSLVSTRRAASEAFTLFCTPLEKSAIKKPVVFNFAETLYEQVNGLKIKGYRWNKDKSVKVLILHGFSSAAYNFHSYVLPLVEKGYEVLAFDAPAHGGSEGKTINVLEYCQVIIQIMNKYGPVNRFISHSFGGIALCLALEKTAHDEKIKMVLIAPATETTTAIDSAFTLLNIKNKKIRTEFDHIIFEKSGHHTEWFSIKRAMKNIKASTLWIHDEEDDTTPLSDALNVKEQQFPNIRFIITKGLGHRRIYRDETIKKEVFDFL